MTTTLIIFIALALVFDFLNGLNDSANIVATIIASRAMNPRVALYATAAAEFVGPFLFGVAVANTIGKGIVVPELVTMPIVFSALISAIIWSIFATIFGVPSSSSHALIGGILGAVIFGIGPQHIIMSGLLKILIVLFASPIIGLVVGYLTTKLIYFLARNASMKINWFFKKIQIITGISLALSYGANDAQKTMGIITLGLVSSGFLSEFEVPLWVIAASAGTISLGTAFGGWRVIRTLGGKFYKIRPVNGFCTQLSSAAVILGAALFGGPVSTTHVVSSTILGVGSAERVNKVRWGVAGNIAIAWLLTIPATALVSSFVYWIIGRLF